MPKKSAPRGKLLQLPKPKTRARAKPTKTKSRKAASTRPRVALQRMPPKLSVDETEERLREAMEELGEARIELSRLGHAMSAAHRQIEDNRLSAASARDNLRLELSAVRTDLKTALAELEIARADRERIANHAQRRIQELEQSLARVRGEVAELRKPAISDQRSAVSPEKSEPGAEG